MLNELVAPSVLRGALELGKASLLVATLAVVRSLGAVEASSLLASSVPGNKMPTGNENKL